MATKFQYALNPFSTSSNKSFPVNQIVMHQSMDEVFDLKSQKIETIKKTMLMHEDIFQLQVRELHRLYDRQMKLMRELKKQMAYSCSPLGTKEANISQFSNWHKQMREIRSNLPVYGLTHDSGERSASCSGESQRMPIGFNLEKVAEECPSTSVRRPEQDQERPGSHGHRPCPSIQMNREGSDEEEIDVELSLSLSIGGSKSRKRSNSERKPCSLELEGLGATFGRRQFSSAAALMEREEFGEPSPALSSSSATQNQDKTTSNWFLQDLRLNRT